MFLIDTDVLSALRRRERSPGLVEWISGQRTTDLYLSVVSVGEVERGIVRQHRDNPVFARELALWLDSVLALYGDRILPVNLSAARRWGCLAGVIGHEGGDLLVVPVSRRQGSKAAKRFLRKLLKGQGLPRQNSVRDCEVIGIAGVRRVQILHTVPFSRHKSTVFP